MANIPKPKYHNSTLLNFKIKGGTEAPANPMENWIWVNTPDKITSWVFSAAQPEAPEEGMVWILTGTSSPVAFNALKKNGIMVYPIAAKQYVDGAWVEKTAKSWQDGAWRDWIIWLFYNSQQSHVWQSRGIKYYSAESHTAKAPTITVNTDGSVAISLSAGSGQMYSGVYELAQDYDLTDCAELVCEASVTLEKSTTMNEWHCGGLAVFPRSSNYIRDDAGVIYPVLSTEESKFTLDVRALSGAYDIALFVNANGFKATGAVTVTLKTLELRR